MPEVKEQTEVGEPQPAAPRKGLLPANAAALLTKIAMFGLIGLVAVFAAFLLTTKVLKPMMAHSSAPTKGSIVEKSRREVAPVESKSQSGEARGAGDEKERSDARYYTIESIVVNPANTGGTRFLSCSVSFEMSGESDVKAFQARDVQIKDILITILSSKTVDELADIKLRNKMRQQMLSVVNHFTVPVQAKAVYLTDFVLQ